MKGFDRDRAEWLAHNILPLEPDLRRWLRQRRHWPLEIDDIVQESYAILAALDGVEHIQNPKAYLYQIARSLVLRGLRKARVVSINAVDDLDALGVASDVPSPETQASDREELGRLADAIERLPAHCREVFKLRKVEGASQKEIAARMGLAESTVEKHIARAVKLLMGLFSHGGTTEPRASIQSGREPRHERE